MPPSLVRGPDLISSESFTLISFPIESSSGSFDIVSCTMIGDGGAVAKVTVVTRVVRVSLRCRCGYECVGVEVRSRV
jgi:hypothetical protein